MKTKNLIYICIGAILLIVCVGFIYVNIDNGSNLIENSSKVNNTNNTNIDNLTNTENSSDNNTNTNLPVKNTKSSNNPEGKKESNNIPKKTKLSYSEALSIAKKASKGADEGNVESYLKYEGNVHSKGNLYWKFNLYTKKDNRFLGGFLINDATGDISLI